MGVPKTDSNGTRAVLPALFRADVGTTGEDDAVTLRRRDHWSTFLYGPYWHLEPGAWRLDFDCVVVDAARRDVAFLGLEVVIQDRFVIAVADFTANDLAKGRGSLLFVIDAAFGSRGGIDPTTEFRFLHYRAAGFTIRAVTLTREPHGFTPSLEPRLRWKLTSRLRSDRLGYCEPSRVRIWPSLRGATLVSRVQPSLALPTGGYRLSLKIRADWLPRLPKLELAIAVSAGSARLAVRKFTPAELLSKTLTLEFCVSADHAQEHGVRDFLSIAFETFGTGGLSLDEIELVRTGAWSDEAAAPAIVGAAATRVVLVGNCQAEVMTLGIQNSLLSGSLHAKYHAAEMSAMLIEQARGDLAAANILFVQDIEVYSRYPLKDELPPNLEVHRFPVLLFATPWPYDTLSGPPDRHAWHCEQAEQRYPNLDGALGRLRRRLPDPEERFRAYRELAFDWPINLDRLASFEERRLQAMDRKYGMTIGADIVESFRKRHDFHSVGHPGGRLLQRLLDHLGSLAGIGRIESRRHSLDALGNVQVPVHPEVARRLGLDWATDQTLYRFRGVPRTWEAYVRDYIRHFG